jgi:Lon protease-like protein
VTPEPIEPFPIPERLPVFALPNVVFFPKTYLPLHIFEPRYRQMVADASAGGQCIAMALLKEGWETEYYGNPPVFPTVCVGRLVSVQPLADGRSNILLQGLERCDIVEEHDDKPYREATVRIRPQAAEAGLEPEVRRRLVDTLTEYLRTRQDSTAWQGLFREEVSDEALVNTLSTYLDCTPLEKQFLLEADGLRQRARRLNDLIQFMLHDHHGATGWE